MTSVAGIRFVYDDGCNPEAVHAAEATSDDVLTVEELALLLCAG